MVDVIPRRQNVYTWYSDQDPQTPQDGHIHAEKTTSSGFASPTTSGGSRLVVVGDHNAYLGDWAVKHSRSNGCPQHIIMMPTWAIIGASPFAHNTLDHLKPYYDMYRDSFNLEDQTIDVDAANLALDSIFNHIDAYYHDEFVDTDTSVMRISANPNGGSNFAQLAAHSHYSTVRKEAIEWSSYHVHSSVPGYDSTNEIEINSSNDSGSPDHPTRYVAGQTSKDCESFTFTGVNAWLNGQCNDNNAASFLFVYWNEDDSAWKPSLYQPHLFDGCDGNSAKVLVRHRHGYAMGAETDSMSSVDFTLPLNLGANGEVSFHIAGISETIDGCWGRKGSGRPYHDLFFSVGSVYHGSDLGYANTHSVGNVAQQVMCWGLGYWVQQPPVDGSDHWCVGAAFNHADRQYKMLGTSLQTITGSTSTIKDFNFTTPSIKVTFDNVDGIGWNPVHGTNNLHGRPYIKEPSQDSVWRAPVPSGTGDTTSVNIMSLPAYNTDFKLWSWYLTDNGCATQCGRYQSLDPNDPGIEASVPGPLWLGNRPQITANLRFSMIGASRHLLPRYTYRVSRS